MITNLMKERKKAMDFLAGDPKITLQDGRVNVHPSIEKEELIESQERKKETTLIQNPRLRTEAYLKSIGK